MITDFEVDVEGLASVSKGIDINRQFKQLRLREVFTTAISLLNQSYPHTMK